MSTQTFETPTPAPKPKQAAPVVAPAADHGNAANAAALPAVDSRTGFGALLDLVAATTAKVNGTLPNGTPPLPSPTDFGAVSDELASSEPTTVTNASTGASATIAATPTGASQQTVTPTADGRQVLDVATNDSGGVNTTSKVEQTQVLNPERTAKAIQERLALAASMASSRAEMHTHEVESADRVLQVIAEERATNTDPALAAELDEREARTRAERSRAAAQIEEEKALAAKLTTEANATTPDNAATQLQRVDALVGTPDEQMEGEFDVTDGSSVVGTQQTKTNLLTGTHATGSTVERSRTVDGVKATDSATVTTDTNVFAGTHSRGKTQTKGIVQTDGSSAASSASKTDSVALGDGITGSREVKHSDVITDAAGNAATNATTVTAAGGLVLKKDEVGVRMSGGASSTKGTTVVKTNSAGEKVEHVDNNTVDVSAGGQVTDKGVQLNGNIGASRETGNAANGAKSSVGIKPFGGFQLDIKKNDDGTYSIVTTVSAGIAVAVENGSNATAKNGVNASAGASIGGSVSGGVTYRRTLTELEMAAYVKNAEALDASGKTERPEPEFVMVANWRAGGRDILPTADILRTGIPMEAAASMRPGDSMETVVSTSGNVGLKGGSGVVGAHGNAEASFTRTLKVAPVTTDSGRRVAITVTVVDASSMKGGVEVSPGIASGEVHGSSSSSSGEALTFHLDEAASDYKDDYAAIVGAGSKEELTTLSTTLAEKRVSQKSTEAEGSGHGGSISVGAGPLVGKGSVDFSSLETSEVTIDDNGLSAEFGGSETAGGALDVNGFGVSRVTENAAVVKVDAEGNTDLSLVETESGTGLGKGGLNGLQSPVQMLRDLLTTTYSEISAYDLSPSEVQSLYSLAADNSRWWNALELNPAKMVAPYKQLQWSLLRPRPEPDWVAADPDVANELARGKAVAHFMAQTGADGKATILHLMRGAGGHGSAGLLTEWPSSIVKHRGTFDDVRKRRDELGTKLDAATANFDMDTGLQLIFELRKDIDALMSVIESCTDFEDVRAKAEMIAELNTVSSDVFLQADRFRQDQGLAPEGIQDEDENIDDLAINGIVEPMLSTLQANKRIENELTATLKDWLSSSMPTLSFGYKDDLMHQAQAVNALWVEQIRTLRRTYEKHGVPVVLWQISSKCGTAPRWPEAEPDWMPFINAYDEASDGHADPWIAKFKSELNY